MIRLAGSGVVTLSLLSATAAWAGECPSPGSEIATDRPDVTNSSLVVPVGSLQGENGINSTGRGADKTFDGTNSRLAARHRALPRDPGRPAELRQGISGRDRQRILQRRARDQIPVQFASGSLESVGGGGRGLADRHHQNHRSWHAALSAIPLVARTRQRLGHQRHADHVLFPVRSGQPPDHSRRPSRWRRNSASGCRCSWNMSATIRFTAAIPNCSISAADYLLTRTQQLDFHLAFGLNHNSPDYIVGVGYSWRFDNLFAAATR